MKSREFFEADNMPEDSELQNMRERKAGERVLHERKIPEMEAWLDKVDFGVLKQMFSEEIQKTTISPEEINLIGKDRISHAYKDGRGAYSVAQNVIYVSYESIRNQSEKFDIDRNVVFLDTFIHEENHAVSKTRCYNVEGKSGKPAVFDSGYSSSVLEQNKSGRYEKTGDVFFLFNEGITEKKAREMFLEYARRTGYGETNIIKQHLQKLDMYDSYSKAVWLVEAFIRRMASVNGISEEAVWGAIKRGYYEGEDMLRVEFQEWFQETLPPDFIDKLMMADYDDMAALLEELEPTPVNKAA